MAILLRKRLERVDRFSLSIFIGAFGFLLVFMVYPVANVLFASFADSRGNLSTINFQIFFSNSLLVESFYNSFFVAVTSVLLTSVIGVPLAYIMARYVFPGKKLFENLLTLPLILPPFVGALGMLRFFGRSSGFNLLSLQLFGHGIIEIQSLWGVVFIEVLHLYPMMYLNALASISNIDPSLEESARNLGASGLRVFRTVTFPLMLPGFSAGALLVFIWSFSDLGTPLFLLGSGAKLLAPQAFLRFESLAVDPLTYVISVLMLIVSAVSLLVVRKYVSMRQYVSLSSGSPPTSLMKHPSGRLMVLILLFTGFVAILSLLPHAGVFLGSISQAWSLTFLPERFTLDHYARVFTEGLFFIQNTILYTSFSTILDVVLGILIAYILVRGRLRGSAVLDVLAITPLMIPGVILGFGYFTIFHDILKAGSPFIYTWLILGLAYAVRRLPYTVRSCYAALQQIHVSLEEASINLGAGKLRTIRNITLPLITGGVFAGGILAFVNAIIEISTTVFIVNNVNYFPASFGIFLWKDRTTYQEAADALGFVMILMVAFSMIVLNRLLGKRMGLLFRAG